MLSIFLIWLASLLSGPDHLYYCREYNLVVGERIFEHTDTVCYLSPLKKTRERYVLTIETDSISYRFGVLGSRPLRSKRGGDMVGSQTLAIILGQPDQLYSIREETKQIGDKTYYFFSVRPIEQNERMNRTIKGRVLEVSSEEEICQL